MLCYSVRTQYLFIYIYMVTVLLEYIYMSSDTPLLCECCDRLYKFITICVAIVSVVSIISLMASYIRFLKICMHLQNLEHT